MDKMNPEIYLDMDGLLVNLFDTLGHKFFNKPYKQLTLKQKKQIKKVWLDKERFVSHFGPIESFFESLEPFGENGDLTKTIVATVIEQFESYNILTHPTALDPLGCKKGKQKWIKTHLPYPPTKVCFAQNKSDYATTNNIPNILIDDYLPYIEVWKAKGGYAIQMRTDSFASTEDLKEFLYKELSAAKKTIQKQFVDFPKK